jgi:hypothetical protein
MFIRPSKQAMTSDGMAQRRCAEAAPAGGSSFGLTQPQPETSLNSHVQQMESVRTRQYQ